MKTKITDKYVLGRLIRSCITTEELNSKYDYSSITDMSFMLSGFFVLKEIPLIDTSNVTNMEGMFLKCESLKTIPLLDTSKVTSMSRMFEYCESLKTIPLIDTSNATNMSRMFYGCDNLINIDPYNFELFDFSNIKSSLFKEKYPELFI